MRQKRALVAGFLIVFMSTQGAYAFLEDLCLRRNPTQPAITWCLNPLCQVPAQPNNVCPQQVIDFATIKPGRSMIHADSTYFIALALGYRSDVAYWIAAYDEVTDYAQYVPIDQCGVQAANLDSINSGKSDRKVPNTGRDYITAAFNGFQRTNTTTDGPLDHYVVFYSPNGTGTDVHGPQGASALYPLHYPTPGYPLHIDDTYQKTLANLRQWALIPTNDPGLLCTVGLVDANGKECVKNSQIVGNVPLVMPTNVPSGKAVPNVAINVPAGPKVLDLNATTGVTTYYPKLQTWLEEPQRTTGRLWKSPRPTPVPVQIARIGLYLHVLQDTDSHATYCGDDAPTPPGGCDPGTYMYTSGNNVQLSFGNSCGTGPHLAGHLQETGTGDASLPLRVYVALNNTVDELIVFGNSVARQQDGWIANPELLPPDVVGGKSAQGLSAAELKALLVGTISSGTAYSGTETYKSGIVTLPLQQANTYDRLHAMNAALAEYGETVRKRSANPAMFAKFEHMPGNSADPKDTSVCWKPVVK